MEQVRSFIAIELPPEIKAELSSLEEKLQAGQYLFVKWVAPNSIHLTLKFLGNIAANKIAPVTAAMEKAVQGIVSFSVVISGLGAFPNWQRPQVIWVGLSGEVETLHKLQQRIDSALSPLGFSPESRSFTPHLTLARFKEGASSQEQREFGDLVASTKLGPSLSFEVDALSLMKSQLTPSGAIYSQIASVKLGKGNRPR